MVKWSKRYAVGIPVVDDQHKEFFRLIGELSDAVLKNEELDCRYLMARLEVYSLYHFTSEEHLMQKYQYPDIDKQIREHKIFRARILSLKEKCNESGELEAHKMLLEFLENWLKNHIIEMDRKYAPYLKKTKAS